MKCKLFGLGAVCAVQLAFAQLTSERRVFDFQNLAAMFAKRYAPADWKKQVSGSDVNNIQPWIDRVRRAADDLAFHEIAAEFVASLDDGHTNYRVPSGFRASLGFVVDIYEGAVLIEQIDRTVLPESNFPFRVGDELVSVDGRSAADLIADFTRLRRRGNPITTRRFAADMLTFRQQGVIPRAGELGDAAAVVIKGQNGELQTYTIGWNKTGLPYKGSNSIGQTTLSRAKWNSGAHSEMPDYLKLLFEMRNWAIGDDQLFTGETHDDDGMAQPRRYILGFGSRSPSFRLPDNFVQRLGRTGTDFHFSGTYEADGMRIGYLRVPSFSAGSALSRNLKPRFST